MATKVIVRYNDNSHVFKGKNIVAEVDKEGRLTLRDGGKMIGMFRYWDSVIDVSAGATEEVTVSG